MQLPPLVIALLVIATPLAPSALIFGIGAIIIKTHDGYKAVRKYQAYRRRMPCCKPNLCRVVHLNTRPATLAQRLVARLKETTARVMALIPLPAAPAEYDTLVEKMVAREIIDQKADDIEELVRRDAEQRIAGYLNNFYAVLHRTGNLHRLKTGALIHSSQSGDHTDEYRVYAPEYIVHWYLDPQMTYIPANVRRLYPADLVNHPLGPKLDAYLTNYLTKSEILID